MRRGSWLHALRLVFSNKIWTADTSVFDRPKRRLIRFAKLVRITVDTFMENRMGFQCVSLCYFVTLAIVPFLAFIFAMTNGLGIADKLETVLYSMLPTYPDLVASLLDKANNIINIAHSNGVGVISALFFFWTVIWLMFQVERVFNNVWGIRKVPRKLYNRFGFYIILLILSPFIILLFGTGIAVYSTVAALIGIEEINVLFKILGWILLFGLTTAILSAMYKFIPAIYVKYEYALKSALTASIVFTIFQYLYLETQTFVTRLNGVYGAMAAIPLFLIWMNFSWQIIMYGAELCYGYQNIDTYNIPEFDND